ncbi:MAG TPA: hypothetical protein DCX89_02415, partial [Saprospirales bacterium]|nr:hypothetical protein [Saprospirales bacterium]
IQRANPDQIFINKNTGSVIIGKCSLTALPAIRIEVQISFVLIPARIDKMISYFIFKSEKKNEAHKFSYQCRSLYFLSELPPLI